MTYMDKRLIGGVGGINNLMPAKYAWSWKMVNDSIANTWFHHETPMTREKHDYDFKLPAIEKEIFLDVFATLTTSDVVIMRNVAASIMRHITAPEVELYLGCQISEERVHCITYQHIIEVLVLDEDSIYNRYLTVKEINDKFEYAKIQTDKIDRFESLESFLEGLFFYYMMFEGVWFYNGFSPIFSIGRRNIMPGTTTQLQYILRDECISSDTELLTPQGWVNVKDINYGTKIAQWNENNTITFVNPVNLSKHKTHTGYWFRSDDDKIDQLVSENHRVVYYDEYDRFCVDIAKNITQEHLTNVSFIAWDVDNSSLEKVKNIQVNTVPYSQYSDDYFYGIEVPSSYILIRRNNSVSVTGNSNHVAFGVKLLRGIFEEMEFKLGEETAHRIVKDSIDLETHYANRVIQPILGYNQGFHIEQAKYIANRRLKQLGYNELYPNAQNVLPWLDEMVGIKKEKNFFETRITEYQSAASLDGTWD